MNHDLIPAMLATAGRWHPVLWRTQNDDVRQTVALAALEYERHGGSWKSHLGRALRTYMPSPVTGAWHKRLGYDLTQERCTAAFEAHGTVQSAAAAMGINQGTLAKRLMCLPIPPAKERMSLGGKRGCKKRWGDYEVRRAKARAMRGSGATLKQIAEALGLTIAGAHYACR